MTISELTLALREALEAWAQPYGGTVRIARGPSDVVSSLEVKPGAPLVSILFEADTPSTQDETGRIDRKFKIVLTLPDSLALRRGDALAETTDQPVSPFDLVEESREVVRQLELCTDGTSARYAHWAGTASYQIGELLFDAWVHDFALETLIPKSRAV
jgi:hypothetical protein